ncbi:DNA-binding SARP family transcriptional activator [Streptomyces sp. 1114.5]|uniref:AfsR/SARP family transcriptional regulator n=1 Tax=Streptomyces sp. 1114.5 TaxID=1938830 RepID=UPI000F17B13A|nr:BTAD domain-containing putative transcriptional regulator [Streptomyces sp. 1114.5]RKT12189.1 DNA-binding SARP family transcriptional activator [Streptomyces sp. 1114.5]
MGDPRFLLLGPLEVWAGDRRIPLGGRVNEKVLTLLLLAPGQALSVSRIVEGIWGEAAPETATHQVRKAVSSLRTRLPGGKQLIETVGTGYRIAVHDDHLDAMRFAAAVQRAQALLGEDRSDLAAEELRTALDLWRGASLDDHGSAVISAASAALEERRMAALEQLLALRLDSGEGPELVGELRDLVAANPLRERLYGHLMLALYRSGRRADALDVFRSVRRLLREDLGVDPGPELIGLHEAILKDSPDLLAASPAARTAPEPAEPTQQPGTVPRLLPSDLPDFVGRTAELAAVVAAAAEAGRAGGRIVAVDGIGGCGKTSFAIRAAHTITAAFPDGQIFLDLQSHSPGEEPISAHTALDILLRSLGKRPDEIPDDLAGRTGMWRSCLTDRRYLLVLDNVREVGQIRPLLPATAGSIAIVTSRARLVDLDGARWVSLGELSPLESSAFLARTLGPDLVAADLRSANDLAEFCGHLPLALRIASARLLNRPGWTLDRMVRRLADQTRRLDELSSTDRSVEATLRSSYDAMEAPVRTAFRLTAQHPGGALDVHSAAALLGRDLSAADSALESLLDVRFLQLRNDGRYGFHDLVRAFALRLPDADGEAGIALRRLLDHYCQTTDDACARVFPYWRRLDTTFRPESPYLPRFPDHGAALEWLDREHSSLIAVVRRAEQERLDLHAAYLARNLAYHLNLRGYFEDYYEVAKIAVACARRLGGSSLLLLSLSNLAAVCWKVGRLPEGVAAAEEGLAASIAINDAHAEARCRGTLGMLLTTVGAYDAALPHLERSIALGTEAGLQRETAESLTVLSMLHENCGDFRRSVESAQAAVDISRRLHAVEIEVAALTDKAVAHLRCGELAQARACVDQARPLSDESKLPGNVALLLAVCAEVAALSGDEAGAVEPIESALRLAEASRTPVRQAAVANIVGRARFAVRDFEGALKAHRYAYRHASTIGYRIEAARALEGMEAAAAVLDGADRPSPGRIPV